MKVKNWKKIYHTNSNKKKAGVAILCKAKTKITRGGEKHYIMIESTNQEYIAILNANAPNNRDVRYIKQNLIELKGEIHKPTNIVESFSIPLSTIAGTTGEKISKDRRSQQYH